MPGCLVRLYLLLEEERQVWPEDDEWHTRLAYWQDVVWRRLTDDQRRVLLDHPPERDTK